MGSDNVFLCGKNGKLSVNKYIALSDNEMTRFFCGSKIFPVLKYLTVASNRSII